MVLEHHLIPELNRKYKYFAWLLERHSLISFYINPNDKTEIVIEKYQRQFVFSLNDVWNYTRKKTKEFPQTTINQPTLWEKVVYFFIFIYFVLTQIQSSVENWKITLKIPYGHAVFIEIINFHSFSNTNWLIYYNDQAHKLYWNINNKIVAANTRPNLQYFTIMD